MHSKNIKLSYNIKLKDRIFTILNEINNIQYAKYKDYIRF